MRLDRLLAETMGSRAKAQDAIRLKGANVDYVA